MKILKNVFVFISLDNAFISKHFIYSFNNILINSSKNKELLLK